jgi:predicted transcriptional regulator of viral defense system
MREARAFLKQKKISDAYLQFFVHSLLEKKQIFRLTRGAYTFQDDIMMSGFAFPPFYYGLQNSLSLNKIWDQATIPIIITPRKIRKGIRKIMEQNVRIRTITPKMFFGYENISYYGFWIPVSTIEKTLIDFAYFNEPLSNESIQILKSKINTKKMNEYLQKVSPRTRKKVEKMLEE